MPIVEFTIHNKKYNISCDNGEEPRIARLANNLSTRVENIAGNFAGASDSVVLAMTALMMEDEINVLKESKNVANQSSPSADSADKVNLALINAIEPITNYIENLANKLESV
jgi:cell division protein ZapA